MLLKFSRYFRLISGYVRFICRFAYYQIMDPVPLILYIIQGISFLKFYFVSVIVYHAMVVFSLLCNLLCLFLSLINLFYYLIQKFRFLVLYGLYLFGFVLKSVLYLYGTWVFHLVLFVINSYIYLYYCYRLLYHSCRLLVMPFLMPFLMHFLRLYLKYLIYIVFIEKKRLD